MKDDLLKNLALLRALYFDVSNIRKGIKNKNPENALLKIDSYTLMYRRKYGYWRSPLLHDVGLN